MLKIKSIGASSNAHKYFAKYAIGHGEKPGVFVDASKELEIHKKEVIESQIENLLKGLSPDGKDRLCGNPGKEHRGGWELMYAPDKSISILWSSASEDLREKIERAHDRAVLASLDYINKNCFYTRVGKGGKEVQKANLVAGIFQHSSNRESEPQLHTHAIVFNLAKTGWDQKWRTCEPREIYRSQMAAGNVYKVQMASQMQALGFETARSSHGFRIKHIPKDVCEKQSERTKQIEELGKEFGIDRHTASAQVMDVLTISSRKAKVGLSRDFSRWQEENESFGFGETQLEKLVKRSKEKTKNLSRAGQVELIDEAFLKVTKDVSTFTRNDLFKAISGASVGAQDLKSLYETLKMSLDSVECICLNPGEKEIYRRYTTKSIEKMEKKTIQLMSDRQGENRHKVCDHTVNGAVLKRAQAGMKMLDEQERALRHITQGEDGVCFVEGDAGTGKTYTLGAVKEVFEKEGYVMRGISFTNKAALQLQKDAGIESSSVQSFLFCQQWEKYRPDDQTIVVLDEAAMLDSGMFNEVVKVCNKEGAKLVCVGDRKQIQPIGRGQMFGTGVNAFGAAKLQEIFRQKNRWERRVVSDLSQGRAERAVDKINEMGNLHFCSGRKDVREKIVGVWFENRDLNINMITATNKEVDVLNQLARQKRVEIGEIDKGLLIETSKGPKEFSVGDKIVFTANDKKNGVLNSMQATIERISRFGNLHLKSELGAHINVNPNEFNAFQHAYAITMHRSQSMTIDKALFLTDGADMEKAYVSFSRGREQNELFTDTMRFGDLPYDIKNQVDSMKSESDKARFLHKIYKRKLALQLNNSHMKDTSQDYGVLDELGLPGEAKDFAWKVKEEIKNLVDYVKNPKSKKAQQEYENELEL